MRSLLGGPGAWLAPAVITGFPQDTTLVSVSAFRMASSGWIWPSSRRWPPTRWPASNSAQLLWTPAAGAVHARGGDHGCRPALPGDRCRNHPVPWILAPVQPGRIVADASWYMIRGGAVSLMGATSVPTPVPGAAGVGEPAVRHPLVSLDQTGVAATDALSGEVLTVRTEPGAEMAPCSYRRHECGGSWDRTGLLWLPDRRGGAGGDRTGLSRRGTRPRRRALGADLPRWIACPGGGWDRRCRPRVRAACGPQRRTACLVGASSVADGTGSCGRMVVCDPGGVAGGGSRASFPGGHGRPRLLSARLLGGRRGAHSGSRPEPPGCCPAPRTVRSGSSTAAPLDPAGGTLRRATRGSAAGCFGGVGLAQARSWIRVLWTRSTVPLVCGRLQGRSGSVWAVRLEIGMLVGSAAGCESPTAV